MTRREEIQWEAGGIVNRMVERGISQCYDTYYQAFQDGAIWADKTMIEKVENYLRDKIILYVLATTIEQREEWFNNFKKAMEE